MSSCTVSLLMIDMSTQLELVFYVALVDMNSLNWALPMGRKCKDGRGASSFAAGKGSHPKRGIKDRTPSPVIGVSFGSPVKGASSFLHVLLVSLLWARVLPFLRS